MKETPVGNPIRQNGLLMMELAGPAGAGKTTLARALSRRSEQIRIGAEIELRKLRYSPVFARSTLLLLPIILQTRRYSRWFTWEEIKYLVYLERWHRVIRQQAADDDVVILLDHGPVFKLATLNAFGPEGFKNQGCEAWWKKMIQQWASTLDAVIWLDAPDPILDTRINSRNQRHTVKGKTQAEVSRFLALYRMSYEEILRKLTTDGGPTLFRFDTSQRTMEQIAEEILGLCGNRINER